MVGFSGAILAGLEPIQKQPAMAPERDNSTDAAEDERSWQMVQATGVRLRLRRLHLGGTISRSAAFTVDCESRLLSWLLRLPNVAPVLTSIKLSSALTDTRLARAFVT